VSAKHVEQFQRAFEPEAFDAADEANLPLAVMAQLSTAVSMKRIADALWGIPNETDGIIQLLNGIEMNGRRG